MLCRMSIPGQIRKNCSRAFEGLSYLAYKVKKKTIMFGYKLYQHTKDLVTLFDPKVHLFENRLVKILAQLQAYFNELTHLKFKKSNNTTWSFEFSPQIFEPKISLYNVGLLFWLKSLHLLSKRVNKEKLYKKGVNQM